MGIEKNVKIAEIGYIKIVKFIYCIDEQNKVYTEFIYV